MSLPNRSNFAFFDNQANNPFAAQPAYPPSSAGDLPRVGENYVPPQYIGFGLQHNGAEKYGKRKENLSAGDKKVSLESYTHRIIGTRRLHGEIQDSRRGKQK